MDAIMHDRSSIVKNYSLSAQAGIYSRRLKPLLPRKLKFERLCRVNALTLVAGMKCNDAIVLAADTEHSDGIIKFQDHKLQIFPEIPRMANPPKSPYRIAIAGAGFSDYIKMTVDGIKDGIGKTDHSVEKMKLVVHKVVEKVHSKIFKHWVPDDPNRPTVGLIVGMRDESGASALLRTCDIAVSEVDAAAFVGSGEPIARYLASGLYRDGISASAALDILIQIFRGVKESGASVGGNTELLILGKANLIALPMKSKGRYESYLWGMNTILSRLVRLALTKDSRFDLWIKQLNDDLDQLKRSGKFGNEKIYEDLRITDWTTDFDDPFGDTH
jgi:20S proteasome alpha/beta subunit